jgi:hypothetical protein
MSLKLPVKILARALCPVLVASALSGCGVAVVDKRTRETTTTQLPGSGRPGQNAEGPKGVPLETFLSSGAVPTRLKIGPELTLTFRSNIADAAFQCRLSDKASFETCAGINSYTFSNLVHARGYQLEVRATLGGSFDNTPLIISFVVDNVDGLPIQEVRPGSDQPNAVDQEIIFPVNPTELPMPVTQGAGATASRKLQVGSAVVLDVPTEFLVTSYATTKTYNNALHLMRIMGTDTGSSLFVNEPCNREFERVVAGPVDYSYCDATPTRDQWSTSYAARIPRNHVEIVKNVGAVAEEKFFISAFDDDIDSAESAIGITSLCTNAVARGQARGPLAEGFYEGQVLNGVITWCQVQDRQGRWWWLGTADINTTVSGANVRARIIYTLAHQAAVYSGQRFASRFSERSTAILSKLAAQ